MTRNPVLERLLEQRSEQEQFIDQLLSRVESESRDLVEAEISNLSAARERITKLDEQLAPLEEFEETRAAHRDRQPPIPQRQPAGSDRGRERQRLSVEEQPAQYRTAGEFVVDLIRSRGFGDDAPDPQAAQRVASVQTREIQHQTTQQTPGLLPEPIVGAIETDLDSSRPFVQSVGIRDLSTIPGKVFHRPRVTQHTQTARQTAEKAELASRQFVVSGVEFTKETFGGTLNVSRQEIDWTSPAAWDALITDLQLEYGADTDDYAATNFAAGITQTATYDDVAEDRLGALIDALYGAAVIAATAGGTKRATALRLPNHIWVSVDMWQTLGAAIDRVRALVQGSSNPGNTSPTAWAGSILDIPRTMVPALPAGSLIVGRTSLYEFYEERIGLLQAVEPKVLGVEVAYGGYAAAGFLDPTGFVKLAGATEPEEPTG